MSRPTDVDLVDHAIPDLLCLLPRIWREHEPATPTPVQEQVLQLKTDAGPIERRASLVACMNGRDDVVASAFEWFQSREEREG